METNSKVIISIVVISILIITIFVIGFLMFRNKNSDIRIIGGQNNIYEDRYHQRYLLVNDAVTSKKGKRYKPQPIRKGYAPKRPIEFKELNNGKAKTLISDIAYRAVWKEYMSKQIKLAIVLKNKVSERVVIDKYIKVNNSVYAVVFMIDSTNLYKGNTNLKSFIVNDLVEPTTNIEDISDMFNGCENLEEIKLCKNFVTTNVVDMVRTFKNCKKLTNVDFIKNFNTNNCYTLFELFNGCECLKNIDISHFNVQNVDRFKSVFHNCISLENLKLPTLSSNKGVNLDKFFKNCRLLKSIDLSQWTLSLDSIECIFSGCYSLEYFKFPTFKNVQCNSLKSLFKRCYNLKSFDLSMFSKYKIGEVPGIFSYCSINTRFGENDNSLLRNDFDFKRCHNLRKMFRGCIFKEFNSIHLYPKIKPMNKNNFKEINNYIKYISNAKDEMFKDCVYLNLIDLQYLNIKPERHIGVADLNIFENCGSLTEMDGDTPLEKDADGELIPPIKNKGDMRIIIANANINNITNSYSQNILDFYKANNEYYYDVNCDNSFHS